MRVVVIGAGIVGLASARFLHAAGLRDLVVLDAASGPGEGTSYANGALLHPSAVEPWNSPGILSYPAISGARMLPFCCAPGPCRR